MERAFMRVRSGGGGVSRPWVVHRSTPGNQQAAASGARLRLCCSWRTDISAVDHHQVLLPP